MDDLERCSRRCERQREVMDWSMDKLQKLLSYGRIDGWDRATIRAVREALSRNNPRLRDDGGD